MSTLLRFRASWTIVAAALLSTAMSAPSCTQSTSTDTDEPPFATNVQHIGVAEFATVVTTGYFPSRQPVIYWHDPDWKVDLVIPHSDAFDDSYMLHIVAASGAESSVKIPEVFGQVNMIYRTPGDKVILEAMCGGTCTGFLIVDLRKAKVIDDIGAEDISISPNRRFILYDNGYPSHGGEDPDEYHLYDTTKSPRENFCGHESLASEHDPLPEDWRGFQVYPQKPGQIYCTYIENNYDTDNALASTFIWSSDSSKVVFADVKSGALSLILVTMPEDRGNQADEDRGGMDEHSAGRNQSDLPQTSIYTFTGADDVCAGAASCDSNNVKSVAWNGNAINVALIQVNSDGKAIEKDLTVPLSKFIPVASGGDHANKPDPHDHPDNDPGRR